MVRNNTLIAQKCKLISVIGIKELDTLISIYNKNGIKAAGLFDNKNVYTYELAIPLKYLRDTDNEMKFKYNIRLNGQRSSTIVGIPMNGQTAENVKEALASFNAAGDRLAAPTDLGGEYILAKK